MPKYYVTIYTTASHTIEVEAANKSAAVRDAWEKWEAGAEFDEESLGSDGNTHIELITPRDDAPQADASPAA